MMIQLHRWELENHFTWQTFNFDNGHISGIELEILQAAQDVIEVGLIGKDVR